MSMMPRESFDVMAPFRDVMSRFFEDSLMWPRPELFSGHTFPLDVRESDDKSQYIVDASLSGVKPEDMQITAEDNMVTIRITKSSQMENQQKGNYVRRERYEGQMSRTIALPSRIDADKIQATYENGVLTLMVPKQEGTRVRQISVKPMTESSTGTQSGMGGSSQSSTQSNMQGASPNNP